MKVRLHAITPDIETTIVEIARVSSSRKDKAAQPERLLQYLIRNKHWSPFQHGFITMEIETSKAIGIQILRHRSFTFQEFSQRYQDVRELGEMFEPFELRKQAESNRQSSTEVFNPPIKNIFNQLYYADTYIGHLLEELQHAYKTLLDNGVARECARMILPMCTKTRIFMTGSVRSWIHFLDLRDDEHSQKEIQEVAREIKRIFVEELPIISKALNYAT